MSTPAEPRWAARHLDANPSHVVLLAKFGQANDRCETCGESGPPWSRGEDAR